MKIRILALCLAVSMLLCGCTDVFDYFLDRFGLQARGTVRFDQMEYTRPDVDALRSAVEDCCAYAETGEKLSVLEDKISECFYLSNSFYTNYNLASIHYYGNTSDLYWEQENDYCMERVPQVDAAVEELYYALADCPFREELEASAMFGEGFFDDYLEGEASSDEFVALQEREAELLNEYYDLNTQSQAAQYYSDAYFETYGKQMGDVFVEMVKVRQEMATASGYDSYLDYAYETVYSRDYSPEQAVTYLEELCRELVPLYIEAESELAYSDMSLCTPGQMYDYVKNSASLMGGAVLEAFEEMDRRGLYDIAYSEDKYNISFEVYLTNYEAPFVFVNPTGSKWDMLTFAHEFGHFCNDYASWGSVVGIDVAEVFSQSMEYLSLFYGEAGGMLEKWKMADSLRLFVEQAAYALFEHRVYALEGAELTAENVYAVYEEVGKAFGFEIWGWDSRDFVLIDHFFSAPLYVISYVVSNDSAFQIYQLEQQEAGAGLALFENNLATQQASLLAFLEEAGLKSPFEPGRLQAVRKTLEDCLT